MSASHLLQVNGLQYTYGERFAVYNLSFEIYEGEIFGLLGPNGAGKTTTISMIGGLLKPDKGDIELAGRPFHGTPQEKRLLGIVPQDLAVYPKLTGKENLAFFGELYGLSGAVQRQRTDEMLALVGLRERAGDLAEQYSGGMKRRLNLAAGLMHKPRLLLLDEPTVGVDPQSRNHIFEGVRSLNKQGLTVLYTSHYMEEVEMLCDRVGIMDGGKLIACDTVEALIARQGIPVIELGVEAAPVTSHLLEALAALEFTEGVTCEPPNAQQAGVSSISVRSSRPDRSLPGIVAALNQHQASLISLSIHRPSLEDVFLALTGKSLRD